MGILPASYDDDGKGGQDVSGEWERVDGILRLNFRKFKKVNDEDSGKKLWQFIGKGYQMRMTTTLGQIT